MRRREDYLRRQYGDRYRTVKRDDGIHYLETLYRARDGMTYDVYDYSDTHLAACLPPRAGRQLLRRYPGVFRVHQDADDGMVLVFQENRLDELAEALKLKRRKKLSQEQRRTQVERLRQFQFRPASERGLTA